MSARACALRIEIDLSQQGAGSDFEVSQALRQLADQIASRRFTGLVEDAQGDLLLAQHGGTYRLAGHWVAAKDAASEPAQEFALA